jgi:DNA invertase Pin-like site-specific DNA recombinase
MVSLSQWEREAIGERTLDALQLKRSRLEYLGNAPYGFRLAADRQHIEPDSQEQSVLKRIRKLRLDGMSLRGIATELNKRQLTTRQGSPWRMEYVARLLKASA